MKLATCTALALCAVLALPAGAGAQAEEPAPVDLTLVETDAPALTPTIELDRQASAAYLDDAETLLAVARQRLEREGMTRHVARELMSASGKLSTSYLLMYRDPAFANRIRPLADACQTALDSAAAGDTEAARLALDRLVPQVARAADEQFAQMGGGAGPRRSAPRP